MFGLKITTQRELLLFRATIDDLRAEREKLREQIVHEQKRAEGAINMLLIKTQKMALTPEPPALTEDQEDAMKARMINIFGNDEDETDVIERVQHDRTV